LGQNILTQNTVSFFFVYFCGMILTDTHTHLYLEDFDADRPEVMARALKNGVQRILLPNIDSATLPQLKKTVSEFPENCFPMMGLHPTSVKKDFETELAIVETELAAGKYYGVGEIGIDLYWDKTFEEEQKEAFRRQLQLAKKYRLAVSIHTRNAFGTVLQIVKQELTDDLKGVFHCFTGTEKEARQLLDTGFKLGIGGIVTFKNSDLGRVVSQLPPETLVVETDAPYLTPAPYRGKRNESAYLIYIVQKIAELQNIPAEKVAEITTDTARQLFFTKEK
jgi:TatD DNase family protein